MEPCYAMVRQQQFEANDKKILIAIHANVNTFTLLDGYQTLGTSRQVMTECNWGGGVVKYLSSDLHTSQRVTPEASGGFKPTCGLATVSRS